MLVAEEEIRVDVVEIWEDELVMMLDSEVDEVMDDNIDEGREVVDEDKVEPVLAEESSEDEGVSKERQH